MFPFCSPHLKLKKWPHYNELIKKILNNFKNKYKVITAPGPNEISLSDDIDAVTVLDNGEAINISQLTSLIKDSAFVVANDTGPAHITAHVGAKGLTLFGKHTTPYKVNIETKNFKAIQVNDLKELSSDKVFEKLCKLI